MNRTNGKQHEGKEGNDSRGPRQTTSTATVHGHSTSRHLQGHMNMPITCGGSQTRQIQKFVRYNQNFTPLGCNSRKVGSHSCVAWRGLSLLVR